MTDGNRPALGVPATLVIVAALALIIAGVLWHGVTVQVFARGWHNLLKRPTGPMKFRFLLQPLMAALVGIRDGRTDARLDRSPYFMRIVRNRTERVDRLRDGLNATARIILLGLAADVIYQGLELRTFYPVEALIVALLLPLLPYVLVRGLVVRVRHRQPSRRAA